MARAMWKGAIQFGLVTIPVKLYLATESKGISFNMLHKTDLSRIQMKVWCPVEDEPISRTDTVKGYEYSPGEYVVITDEDLERVPLKTVRSIEIEQFTKAERDDAAIRFVKSAYYLEPDKIGRKAFYLLKSVLEEDGLTAICKVVIKDREALAALDPFGDTMLMTTLHWPDEIRSVKELDLPDEEFSFKPAELAMAKQLVSAMTGEFDPAEYKDEYREALETIIQAKVEGKETVEIEAPEETGNLIDLMAALEASVTAAKAAREAGSRGAGVRRRREGRQGGQGREGDERRKQRPPPRRPRRPKPRRPPSLPASARRPDVPATRHAPRRRCTPTTLSTADRLGFCPSDAKRCIRRCKARPSVERWSGRPFARSVTGCKVIQRTRLRATLTRGGVARAPAPTRKVPFGPFPGPTMRRIVGGERSLPMFDLDIAEQAERNSFFRQVLTTGEHSQVVVMCIPPGGEIGDEVHETVDQVLIFVEGIGEAILNGERGTVLPGRLVFVPAGTRHNFINTGSVDMRLYTIYAPPEHAPGTVHRTKAEADAAESRPDHRAGRHAPRRGIAPGSRTRRDSTGIGHTDRLMPLEEYRRKRDFTKTPEPAPAAVTGSTGSIRDPAPSRHAPALRLPAGDRGRAGLLGRAQGPDPRSGRAAHGGPRRGPPDRVLRLRGRDPRQAVRLGRRHRLGLGHLGARGADPRPSQGRRRRGAEVPPRRREAEGPLHDRPDERPKAHGRRPRRAGLRGRRRASSGCSSHKRGPESQAGWDAEDHPQSVKTGRTNDDVKADRDALWNGQAPAASAEIDLAGAVTAPMPTRIEPMLATLASKPFSDPDWLTRSSGTATASRPSSPRARSGSGRATSTTRRPTSRACSRRRRGSRRARPSSMARSWPSTRRDARTSRSSRRGSARRARPGSCTRRSTCSTSTGARC